VIYILRVAPIMMSLTCSNTVEARANEIYGLPYTFHCLQLNFEAAKVLSIKSCGGPPLMKQNNLVFRLVRAGLGWFEPVG
jgi:hypothetical protein